MGIIEVYSFVLKIHCKRNNELPGYLFASVTFTSGVEGVSAIIRSWRKQTSVTCVNYRQ